MTELQDIARQVRMKIIEMAHAGKAAHVGSALSCVDALAALYWRVMHDGDKFILSKGHAILAQYVVLAMRHYFPMELLDTFGKKGSPLHEQPSPRCVPGIECATGSLGHGLSIGAGMALANKIAGKPGRVFVLLGDGECNEGSVWEAAMFAADNQLDNLYALVDLNQWQGIRCTGLDADRERSKWQAFGWHAYHTDGHAADILGDLIQVPNRRETPSCCILKTVKGRGVSFMKDDNNWHYKTPTAADVEAARKELMT